ncbi:MAG: sarcosine oxidase subunit alpha family protein, partial [Pseudomonadota bacterium]
MSAPSRGQLGQAFRLTAGGHRIDRSRPITIRFNGRALSGFHGDSVASIMLAHGQHLAGRSFKYHRPRGLLTAGVDEPNALLDVDRGNGRRDPNNRAPMIEAFDGLSVRTQNHFPSLERDVGIINDRLAPLFAAGFYYKTFMWPQQAWTRLYEPVIRRMAGLGEAPKDPDPDQYLQRHAHCDVLIVGMGPAGLTAAMTLSTSGLTVLVCDDQPTAGGGLAHMSGAVVDQQAGSDWAAACVEQLDASPNVTVLPRTTAFGYYNHNHIALAERISDHVADAPEHLPRERLWQVRARQVIVAAGAHERPLVFANNDRPGVMLADAMRHYLNAYGVVPGQKAVIATSGASAYATALDLAAAGVQVAIADLRLAEDCGSELAAARAAGIEVLSAHTVVDVTGTKRVTGIALAPITADGAVGEAFTLACDCIGMSGGWTPAVHLFSQSRGKLAYDAARDMFVPGAAAQAMRSAGACNGTLGLADIIAEGRQTAIDAAAECGVAITPEAHAAHVNGADFTGFQPVRVMPSSRDQARERAFVDFQNDVTAKDLKLAVREGFESIEHVKRYTTTGMATDQGKTSNMNALGFVAGALNRDIPQVGTTTFRLPYTPVTFGTFAGTNRDALFAPVRTTPVQDWALKNGATFEDVSQWKRAWYFPRGAETMREAVNRECRAVRDAVGLFDASTLGKIEVVGPDAAAFLNRVYTNGFLKLGVGRCRYGLMLKEDGYIMDDGVVGRLADDRFHVTTTTGAAPRVLAHMEDYLQTEWTNLRVYLTSITEQWATIAVQGPHARAVIADLVDGIDLANSAMPHMSVRVGRIAGAPCRLFRMSFTGELGYEINVPSRYGLSVWTAVHEAGQPYGITPYGTEAMHVLRAERGFIIVGQETDGTMTPDDVGLGGMVSQRKSDFIGMRSLARPDLVAGGRKQLVGLLTDNADLVLDEGAQIVADPAAAVPVDMLGHVT